MSGGPSGPLTGVRVVDLSQIASGPYGTMILAEQGADVIKIEPIGMGDMMRIAPIVRGGLNAAYLNLNHGKRSIALDIASTEGRGIVLDLIEGADVVVQNFRPGVADRLGVGYDAAVARTPDIVYVSISGYGPDGPLAQRAVVDPIIQGHCGIIARQQSEAIPIPDLVRNVIVDKATALNVAQGVCAALFRRERTGEGDHLEVAMLDVGMHFFWPDGMSDHTFVGDGVTPGPRIPDLYSVTHCADGQLVYYSTTDEIRHGLFRAVGRPELCDDPRFATATAIVEGGHLEELGAILVAAFAELPVDAALQRLIEEDVPAGKILEPEEVLADEQVVHNGILVEWEHPTAGRVRQPRHAIRFAGAQLPIPQFVPHVGEHTDEVLAGLGRSGEEIAALRSAGVIA